MPSVRVVSRQIHRDGYIQTFNWRDIRLELLLGQVLRLKPISHDQLSAGIQQLGSILEEKLLVWKMAHSFRDPHTVKLCNIRFGAEEVSHFLGIELDEADRAVAQLEGVFLALLLRTACLQCQFLRNLNLPATDCHSRDFASVILGQMTCRAADSTTNIEDLAAFW